ncbi:hypothetical protein LIER_27389 [Lithospermum erythrorhizon]|uniref:Uncharacterized protein n=1 Tax=Lithospermum erythrorhizon TaxID=34254 RepID=A0AAV3RBW6_LITER
MVKTQRGVNASEKATKGKKGIGTNEDASMVIEPPVVYKEAQKAKGRKSKTPASTKESHDEIHAEEDVIGEEVAPIVEEGVNDSSRAEMSEVADVSDPPTNPSVEDTMGKTAEPSAMSDKSTGDVGKDIPEGDDVNVSHADKVVTDGVKIPKPVTAKAAGKGVIPSVFDTNDEIARSMERPTAGEGVDDTLDANIQEVIPKDAGQKKKSKKRKHKRSADVGESSEPKKKLSKEERKDKRERKAERKAKMAAEEEADVHEEAEDHVREQEVPQGNNVEEEA